MVGSEATATELGANLLSQIEQGLLLRALQTADYSTFGTVTAILPLRLPVVKSSVQSSSSSSGNGSSSSSSSVDATGVAVGVVFGVLALVMVIVFVVWYRRRRHQAKNLKLEYNMEPMVQRKNPKGAPKVKQPTNEVIFAEAMRPENKSKNRYRNVLPYNHNRVRLTSLPAVPYSDYINASYVHGYFSDSVYICCQGPTETTLLDFWRMIWEQHVSVIAMLTRLREGGVEKVKQYWPDTVGQVLVFGDLEVQMEREKDSRDYILRTFRVRHKFSGIGREVYHLQYLSWPDHGAPEETESFLEFRKRVSRKWKADLFWERKKKKKNTKKRNFCKNNDNMLLCAWCV